MLRFHEVGLATSGSLPPAAIPRNTVAQPDLFQESALDQLLKIRVILELSLPLSVDWHTTIGILIEPLFDSVPTLVSEHCRVL